MAFPPSLPTRQVSFGSAVILEDGTLLRMVVEIQADKSLTWKPTGQPLVSYGRTFSAEEGAERTMPLPVTDAEGYINPDTRQPVDVSDGKQSHSYSGRVVYYLDKKEIKRASFGPFVLPADDGSVVDIDTIIPFTGPTGVTFSLPDQWTALVERAEAAATEAAAAVAIPADFIGSEIGRTGSPAHEAVGRAVIRPNSLSTIGDSITASAKYVVNGSGGTNAPDNSWLLWAYTYLGQRLSQPNVYAVSGKRTDEMIVEQLPQVLATPTTYCTVVGGTNDIPYGATSAQITANLATILDALVAAGIRPIIGEITPRSGMTSAQNATLHKVNAWIRQSAPRRGAWVVSWHAAMANSDGSPKAKALTDGLHPSAFGAEIMGRKFAQAVDQMIPRVDRLPASNAESPDVVILNNPMMIGTGGNILVAGGTGQVATNFTVSAWSGNTLDAVCSKVPRTDDVPGEWQKIVVNNDASAQHYQSVTTAARWSAGDSFEAFVEVEADANLVAPTGFEVMTLCQPSGRQSFAMAVAGVGTDKATPHAGVLPTPPVVRVPPITIPADTTQVWLLVRVKGDSGALHVGRAALQRVVS